MLLKMAASFARYYDRNLIEMKVKWNLELDLWPTKTEYQSHMNDIAQACGNVLAHFNCCSLVLSHPYIPQKPVRCASLLISISGFKNPYVTLTMNITSGASPPRAVNKRVFTMEELTSSV